MAKGPKSWTEWILLAVGTSIVSAFIWERLSKEQAVIDFYGGLTHT